MCTIKYKMKIIQESTQNHIIKKPGLGVLPQKLTRLFVQICYFVMVLIFLMT